MTMLKFALNALVLLNITHATYYAYVRQSGWANTACTYFSPCRTIQTVISNINNGNIQYDDEVYITVESTYSASLITESYCFTQITGNITIDFNSNFLTATEWFPGVDTCVSSMGCGCMSAVDCDVCTFFTLSENANLKMKNLIWDKSFALLDTLTSSTFYCDNCLIHNIASANIALLFLFANAATFYNSTFENIQVPTTVIGLYPWKGTLAAEYTDTSLNMSHCIVSDIVSDNFIAVESRLNYKKYIHIEYSQFSTSVSGTITKFIYVSSDLFINAINTINIISSTFTDNSDHNGLVLIDIIGSANCEILINETEISYSQYLDTELLNSASPPTGIVISNPSRNTNIEMNDVLIITKIYCSYDDVSIDVGRRRNLLQAYSGPPDVPFCNSPTPFLLNNGNSKLTNISLQTDFDWYTWYWYFYWNSDYRNSGIYFLRLEYYDTTLETDNEPYFAAIVNLEDGVMDINEFKIAIGSHFSVLYNQEGTVNINGLYSEFHNDPSSYYNRWNLRFYTLLTNNFGTLTVSDSVMQGADTSLINIYGGDVAITDSILAQAMFNIVTYYTANSIYLDNINVYEVGQYYASLGAAIYFSRSNEELYYIPPTMLSAESVTILNSFMYYIGPFGILKVSKYGLFNVDDGNANIKKVTVMNNSLVVTETLNNNLNNQSEGYQYFTDFDYLSSLLTETYGSTVPISNIEQFITDINSALSNVDGLVIFDNQYQLTLGNNFIYFENKNFLTINSQIYIDTDEDNCIAGNQIYNIDLYAKSGSIKSCKHKNNTHITRNNSCQETFGVLNNTFSDGLFVNSSIIIDTSDMVVIDDVYLDYYGNIFQIIDSDQNITIVFLDVTSSIWTELKLPDSCHINCHQIINNDVDNIRQLIVNCNHQTLPAFTINIKNNTDRESFSYGSPFRVVLTNETSIFPGGTLLIHYRIVDKYNKTIEIYNAQIEIHLINTDVNINALLTINRDGICDVCESGLYVQGISIKDVNKSFILTTFVADNSLLTNDIYVSIVECPFGYGISGASQQCDECSPGTYSLQSSADRCIDCNDDELDGVECFGGSYIVIEYNYWMDIIEDGTIINSDCPNKYCCQHMDGCDYIQDFNESLCALYRDPTVPLCGACVSGMSELLGTVNCGICDRNYYEYLLIPMIIVVVFSVYLLCFDQPPKASDSSKQPQLTRNETSVVVPKTMLLGDDIRALKIMIFKVILYYGQGLLYIIEQSNINSGLFYFLLPVLQFMNLSIDFGVNSSNGYCVFAEMTALQEILLNLVIPIGILSFITIAILTKFCGLDLVKMCCCCCKRTKGVIYYSAFLKALLISIGSIFAVLFKILSCRDINNGDMVHYYYGSVECFDSWWYLSLIVLAAILIIWLILFVKLYHLENDKRQSVTENSLYTLVRAYKPRYWFWESVLLSRRFFLALFTIITDKYNYLSTVLNILLCIYGFVHVWKCPFKYKRINKLETLCILVLIIVLGFVNVNKANQSESDDALHTILGLFLFICIVSPLVVVTYEGFRICKHVRQKKISTHKFKKVQHRKPGNQDTPTSEVEMEETGYHK